MAHQITQLMFKQALDVEKQRSAESSTDEHIYRHAEGGAEEQGGVGGVDDAVPFTPEGRVSGAPAVCAACAA